MCTPGARLAELSQLVAASLRPETKVLVMVTFYCDLTYLTNYVPSRPRGLLRLLCEPPWADIFNIVTGLDYRWRTQEQLTVVWVLHYTQIFLLYNQRRARLLGMGESPEKH